MTKDEIKKLWQSGDNTAAAALINERYASDGISVTKYACRSWLKQATNSSPLSAIYIWAFKTVIEQRKSANNE